MSQKGTKPLTKEALKLMVEGVAAQLASNQREPWWSVMHERLKNRYRRQARKRLEAGLIAGIPGRALERFLAERNNPQSPDHEHKERT